MVINETALLASPLLGPIAEIMQTLEVLVGGLFGLYLILLFLRWIEYKKQVKILKEIRIQVYEINQKLPEKRRARKKKK